MKVSILVVEDDKAIRNFISATLDIHSYNCFTAENGEQAMILATSHKPDIIILDLGLPDIDGVDIIKKIRAWSNCPIIVVSARSEDKDKIEALDSGADDYLTKPFSVDYVSGCVFVGKEETHLTPIEYKLLCLLAKNVGKVLTHTYILKEIWGVAYESEVPSLRVFMATLRKKIEKNCEKNTYIQTHIGVGYRLVRIQY